MHLSQTQTCTHTRTRMHAHTHTHDLIYTTVFRPKWTTRSKGGAWKCHWWGKLQEIGPACLPRVTTDCQSFFVLFSAHSRPCRTCWKPWKSSKFRNLLLHICDMYTVCTLQSQLVMVANKSVSPIVLPLDNWGVSCSAV